MTTDLILASSSQYRKALLDRLQLSYRSISPDIDETPLENEMPLALVKRLALHKAMAIQENNPSATIIGSDQVSVNNQQILGKPHTAENAFQQLRTASGETVSFLTSLAVLSPSLDAPLIDVAKIKVQFRNLSDEEIHRYISKEAALDCAGSFKSEGLGVSLFESVQTSDLTALEGLPLIRLCEFLRQAGFELP